MQVPAMWIARDGGGEMQLNQACKDEWEILLDNAGPKEDFDLELLWITPARTDDERGKNVPEHGR